MKRLIKKAFTLVELLVVIAILATLSAITIVGYNGFSKKANETADNTLLTQVNTVLKTERIRSASFTAKEAYSLLEDNGLKKEDLVCKQVNYSFVFNKNTNLFEIVENSFKDTVFNQAKTLYSSINDFKNSFGAIINSNKVIGYEEYTGSTTFTYKYLTSDNQVIVGDTITENNTLTYFLHVPENYDPRISYPLITQIHGSGGCNYLQYSGYGELRKCDDNELDNGTYAERWLKGNNNQSVYTKWYKDEDALYKSGGDGALPGWDTPFTSAWFDWVKLHPEDDCFYIFTQLNDETWFENPATYTYTYNSTTYTNLKQLSISNCYKASNNDNNNLYGTKSGESYNNTYNSSVIGTNVWFQLLHQLEDKLINRYNIDEDKIFVLGASLGGISSIELLFDYPNRYAAIFPCATPCADTSDSNITNIKNGNTKVIAFHGSNDGAVSSAPIASLVSKLQAARADAQIYYSNYGHSSQPLADNVSLILDTIRNTSR